MDLEALANLPKLMRGVFDEDVAFRCARHQPSLSRTSVPFDVALQQVRTAYFPHLYIVMTRRLL